MINLTEKDNDRQISVKKNETVLLTLPYNPSTGYFWQATETPGVLEEVQHHTPSTLVGGMTNISFVFRIDRDGPLLLHYARPWGETEPAKTYNVTMKVI